MWQRTMYLIMSLSNSSTTTSTVRIAASRASQARNHRSGKYIQGYTICLYKQTKNKLQIPELSILGVPPARPTPKWCPLEERLSWKASWPGTGQPPAWVTVIKGSCSSWNAQYFLAHVRNGNLFQNQSWIHLWLLVSYLFWGCTACKPPFCLKSLG